jgi:hypothetical protein
MNIVDKVYDILRIELIAANLLVQPVHSGIFDV